MVGTNNKSSMQLTDQKRLHFWQPVLLVVKQKHLTIRVSIPLNAITVPLLEHWSYVTVNLEVRIKLLHAIFCNCAELVNSDSDCYF